MKKINVEKIIAIAEIPGLYRIITNGVKGVIVENIIDKRRTIVLNNSKIFSLDTIRIFLENDEMPVGEALYNLYKYLDGKPAPHHKTASDDEIISVFQNAIPNYDKERVHINNMRKLFQWYNTLHQANLLEIVEDENNETAQEQIQNTNNIESSKENVQETANAESAPKKRGRKKKTDNE